MSDLTSKPIKIHDIDLRHDSLFMNRLKGLEYRVDSTTQHLRTLEVSSDPSLPWGILTEMIQTFLNSVHMMQVTEMQRTQTLHRMLDELVDKLRGVERLVGDAIREQSVGLGISGAAVGRGDTVMEGGHEVKRRRLS